MNTDLRAKFDSVIDTLGIRNDMRDLVCHVYTFVEQIWLPDTDHAFYTSHDLEHSLRIIQYFASIKPAYDWSIPESVVFTLAALIHDIGMQYNIWRARITPPITEDLSLSQIRDQHTHLMHTLMRNLLADNWKISGVGLSDITRTSHNLIWMATKIAGCHSKDDFLNEVFDPTDATWKEQTFVAGGERQRPRLLAVMLRLLDELDGSYRRLRGGQENKLFSASIDDHTLYHWLACWFVSDTSYSVDKITRASRITVHIRIPDGASDAIKQKIITLVANKREQKLQDEVTKLQRLLQNVEEAHLFVTPSILIDRKDTIRFGDSSINELERHLDRAINSQPQGSSAPDPVRSSTISRDNIQLPLPTLAPALPLTKRLENWFFEHRDYHHFELTSGEHTDTYVHCRSLLHDPDLLWCISDALYDSCKSGVYDHIIAVGTSATPIGVALSQRLNVPMSIWMYSEESADSPYFFVEKRVSIKNARRLLLVDDIISSGRVASTIVAKLGEKGLPVESVTHLAVFKLGDRAPAFTPKVLLTRPEVRYYQNVLNCDLCKNHLAYKRERDIR